MGYKKGVDVTPYPKSAAAIELEVGKILILED